MWLGSLDILSQISAAATDPLGPLLACLSTATAHNISSDVGLEGGGDQAYSRLSTTHGHITDCKLDSVVYAGVGVVI